MALQVLSVIATLCSLFVGTIATCGEPSAFKSSRCSPELAYHCYHDVSMKIVIDRWIPASSEDSAFFTPICSTCKDLPLRSQCKYLYSGCFESEKQQFRLHEQGYDFLRFMSLRLPICLTPGFLHDCVDFDVLEKCYLVRPHAAQRLRDFRKQSYSLVENFTACVDRALEKCDNASEAENLNVVKLVLAATSNLNWFDENAEPEPTTTVPTTSTQAPSTSRYTQATTERASEASTEFNTRERTTTPEVTTGSTKPHDPTHTTAATTKARPTPTTHFPDHKKEHHNAAPKMNAFGSLVLVAVALHRI